MTEPGFQVAPVTESDMNIVRDIFDRMARNIVNAAGVTSDLQQVRDELEALRAECQRRRERERELDEMVASVRNQRDDALMRAETAERRVNELQVNRDLDNSDTDRLRRDLEDAQARIVVITRERDDAYYANISLDDKLKVARTWIEDAARLFANPPSL